ncbi:variant SH3 domain protein, partial [Opisthorchis viverrini]
IKLRELEKRCALQQLLQEEVLLELEGARKRERLTEANEQLFSSADQAYRSTLADFSNISLSTSGLAKVDYANYNRSTEATDFSLGSGSTGSTTRVNIKRCVLGSGPVAVGKPVTSDEQDPNLVELFQTSDEPFEISDIRAPRMLTLERQLVHSVLISWKPPDVTTTGQTVSAYHVYVDGQFRLAVKAKEKTRALLDRVDADKPHRISVRAISTKGQSKDAACTLVVGRGMTATPGRLRATQITTNSAKLSWMPGNSNYWHRIFLNQQELCTCPPGVYKILLTDLPPDALHWVCVQAVVQKTNIPESQKSPMSIICSPRSGVDTQKLAAFIEFRTLPIGLPDPPTNVQLEPGPQDGMLLVTWLPVPQDQGAAAAATAAGAGITLPVQGYTVCLNENSLVEVAESTNDHAIIPLQQIKCHLEAAGTTSSVTRSSETETSEATLADNRQLSPDLPDTGIPQHLFITVHSTVPREATESKTAFANSESPIKSNILKGAAGPGSLPVNLTAGLLLASAGSLQAARRIFGSRLSLHLGIDEAAAKRAGVPLIVEREMSTSPPPTTQVGHVSTLDPGLVMVSADLTARKLSPTADAIGSAEALLRRRKLDDNEEHSAPNSSPEMNLPEIERGFHRNRFRSHPIHSSEPWPWPESHAGRPGHPPHLPVTRRPPTNSSYARKSWRQFRSLSDDHDPRLFYAEQIDLDDFREDSNDTAPSQDVRVSGPNRWFRTSSLYNIHQKRPIRGRRPRGSAKSSWDLRNLEVSPRYLEDEQFKRGDGIRFCSARCQRFPVDQSYQEYTARCGSMPWDEVTHRGAAAPYSVFTKFGHRFRDQFETEVPGPIIRAFSSSSNDDKYSYYVPDIFTEQRFSSGQVMLPTRKPGYYRPRSRSASPHRPQHQYGPRVVPTTWASRLFEFDNQVAPEAQGYWPPNPSRTHRSLIRHAGHGSVGSRHKAHTSGHPVHSVPEIQIHQDSETSGPPRRTRSKHMDLRGYHEELRPELTPQHFKITEQLVDPCSQQPKFVHAPKSSVEGRRKLQNTTALPGTAPFLSNYPSEPPFPSTSGTHDTTHINTSSRVPQELTQPVPPPVALDEFQRSYHKDGGDQSSTYGLPVQQRFQDTKALRFVVALYAYDPATMSPNPDAVQEELPFQEGQIIKIFGDCDEDGFYYGECNGLRGLVPSNMVSKPERDIGPTDSTYPGTSNRMEQVMNQERPRYPEGPSLPPGQLSRPRHRHYGTMHASHQNVPSHQISDTMTGRPYGSTSAIQNGVAFAAQSHSRRSPLDNPPLPQCKSTNTVANLYAQEDPCYDFSRQPSMREPSLRTSQQPISRQMRAPQLAGANDPGKQSLPGMSRQMVALYDYDPSVLSPNADADRELSFRSGERIVVYGEMDEDGFYEGELSDGRRGLVPSNFLRDIRTDIDPMDRRASITARSSQKRSQADSGSFMNSTYKNETSQAPTGPSTSAGYRRDQEKVNSLFSILDCVVIQYFTPYGAPYLVTRDHAASKGNLMKRTKLCQPLS